MLPRASRLTLILLPFCRMLRKELWAQGIWLRPRGRSPCSRSVKETTHRGALRDLGTEKLTLNDCELLPVSNCYMPCTWTGWLTSGRALSPSTSSALSRTSSFTSKIKLWLDLGAQSFSLSFGTTATTSVSGNHLGSPMYFTGD